MRSKRFLKEPGLARRGVGYVVPDDEKINQKERKDAPVYKTLHYVEIYKIFERKHNKIFWEEY